MSMYLQHSHRCHVMVPISSLMRFLRSDGSSHIYMNVLLNVTLGTYKIQSRSETFLPSLGNRNWNCMSPRDSGNKHLNLRMVGSHFTGRLKPDWWTPTHRRLLKDFVNQWLTYGFTLCAVGFVTSASLR